MCNLFGLFGGSLAAEVPEWTAMVDGTRWQVGTNPVPE